MCTGFVLPDGTRCTSIAELEAATGRVAPSRSPHDARWTAFKRERSDWRNVCLCDVDVRLVAKRAGWRLNTYAPFDVYAIAKDGTRADSLEVEWQKERAARMAMIWKERGEANPNPPHPGDRP